MSKGRSGTGGGIEDPHNKELHNQGRCVSKSGRYKVRWQETAHVRSWWIMTDNGSP